MKKKVLSLVLALIMVLSLVPVSAFAATQTGIVPFNLNYSYNTSTKTLTVSGSGELQDTQYYSYFQTFAHLPVHEIKKVVIQSGVTKLGNYAFKDFYEMTSITIPDTVTRIGKYAFDYCRSLESIKLPKNLTKIGDRAFNDCFSLKSITIPAKVTEVGASAFVDNYALKSVTFKGAFTMIGKNAFGGCENLETVTFPAKAGKNASIEDSAFYQCDALESVVIPEGVDYIGEDVFYGCEALKTVVLPSTLEYLWDSTFYGCDSLETVTFKGDAPRFGYDVFGDVTTTAYYPAGNETWTEDVLKNYGGTITWKSVCMDGHDFVDGSCTNCDAECVRIITQPQSVKVKDGETAAVTVVAEGPGLKYTWYYAAAGSKTFKKTDSFKTNTYSIAMNESRAGRQVYCEITDANGYKVKTDTVTLAMDSELIITAQPESVMVGDGKTAAVTVKASGFGLKYEWYWAAPGSDDFALTTSFKTNTYSVAMNEARDGRQVYCKVYDKFGNMVQSDIATLTMAPPPVIVKDLEDVSVLMDETARVSVEMAEAEGLTYEWYYAAAGSKTFKKTDSFQTNEYFITMNDSRAGRKVYCVITDQYGASVKTATVTLGMKSDLAIVKDLTDAKAANGKKATVTVKANGKGLTYEWYYSDDNGETFKKTTSFKTATYSLTMNEARDGRQVYCKVYDKYGNMVQSATATLTMVPPPQIVVEPTFVYARKGEEAVVSFEATGTGELTYEWYWAKAGSSTYKKTASFTGPEYKVEMTDDRAGRKVYCVVTDESGASVKTKTVTIRMELEITKNIESVCGSVGDKAVFTVEANGQGLTYEWYYADEGDDTFKKTDTFKGNTYSVTYTNARMGRRIYCVITDKYGNTVETSTAWMDHL